MIPRPFVETDANTQSDGRTCSFESGPARARQINGAPTLGSRKLFFLTNADGFGGTEKHLLDLIHRLPKSEVQPTIVQLGADVYTDHVNEYESNRIDLRSERIPNSPLEWFRFFRRNRPDIVLFINNWVRSFPWYAPLAAFLAGVPRRFEIQHLIASPLEKVEGWSVGSLLRRLIGGRRRTRLACSVSATFCDATICVSNAVRDRLVNDYRFPADKTITIHNGVSILELAPSESCRESVRASLCIGSQEFVLVCTARLNEVKGIDILLLAMAKVLREGLHCKCVIVGDGPLRESLLKQAEALGLDGRVFFVGFHKNVQAFLSAADAFVLTSYKEGLPLSILEAMACGLPCIVTNVGGNAEAIQHSVHGLIVEPGSVDQVAAAISYLMSHPQVRTGMSKMAQERVREGFDVDVQMAKINRVIFN
jgi:glycosyltransferase involved in cell wall biosynthesis